MGLTGGHPLHGEPSLDQWFAWRPMLGFARYRMPVDGLYLCGSGAHPGGGVTGVPGRNAAREILADARRERRDAGLRRWLLAASWLRSLWCLAARGVHRQRHRRCAGPGRARRSTVGRDADSSSSTRSTAASAAIARQSRARWRSGSRRGSGTDQAEADARTWPRSWWTSHRWVTAITITARRMDAPVALGDSGADVEVTVPPAARLELRTSNGRHRGDQRRRAASSRAPATAPSPPAAVDDLDLDTTNGSVSVQRADGRPVRAHEQRRARHPSRETSR